MPNALPGIDFRVIESVPDLYLVLSPQLTIISASNAYLSATLTERDMVIGKYIFDIFPDNPEIKNPEGVVNLRNSLEYVIANKKPHSMQVQRYDVLKPEKKGGGFELKYWSTFNNPVLNSKGEIEYIIHKVIDITKDFDFEKQIKSLQFRTQELINEVNQTQCDLAVQLKEVDQLQKHNEKRFKLLLENLPQITWTNLPSGEINFLNERWYQYTGLDLEKSNRGYVKGVIHPEDLKPALEKYFKALNSKMPFQMELRLKSGFDNSYKWFLTQGRPLLNEQGESVLWIGTCTDINDRKIMEEDLAHKNTLLNKTNTDLDNFVYTASHDLKAPISNIEGLINALPESVSEETNKKEEFYFMLKLIKTSVTKFKQTILDLTEISKVQRNYSEDIGEVDICMVIDEVQNDIFYDIKKEEANITINTNFCPTIKFSKKNLRSIIYNLLSNAIKYRSPQRKPEINIDIRSLSDFILLTVKDNGLGVPQEKIDHIFGMFKRMHSHVEGTGIGLYIVKRIVENTGGKIEVESEVDKGTIFKIFLRMQ